MKRRSLFSSLAAVLLSPFISKADDGCPTDDNWELAKRGEIRLTAGIDLTEQPTVVMVAYAYGDVYAKCVQIDPEELTSHIRGRLHKAADGATASICNSRMKAEYPEEYANGLRAVLVDKHSGIEPASWHMEGKHRWIMKGKPNGE